MPTPSRFLVPLLLAPAALIVLAAACGDDPPPPAPPPPVYPSHEAHQGGVEVAPGLVTLTIGARCVECHEDVVEAYRESAMHEALSLPTGKGSEEAALVGQTFVDEETGISIRCGLEDGRYTQTLFYVDPGGVERYAYKMAVDLVVGSGHATRSYFAVRKGRLLELPLTWYAQIRTAALSPGPGFKERFTRLGTRLCVSCHTGIVTPVSTDSDSGFRGEISLGIACERCHGESEEHCLTGDPSTTINPSKLPVDRQADLCFQCHLSGVFTAERRGRTIADYRPGERLAEWIGIMELADQGPEKTSKIAGHGERMKLSKCFTESLGGSEGMQLTCTTCHNPHHGFKREDIAQEVDRGCLVCHKSDACHGDEAARDGKACFQCHMAEVLSKDIGHTKITDHWIRRELPANTEAERPKHVGDAALTGGRLVNHLDRGEDIPGGHLLLAKSYLRGVELAAVIYGRPAPDWTRRCIEELDAHEKEHGRSGESAGIRGRLFGLTGRPADGVALLREELEKRPDLPGSHYKLAYALMDSGRAAEAVPHLRIAVELDPFDDNLPGALAEIFAENGLYGEALDALDALIAIRGPVLSRSRMAMQIAVQAGKFERALGYAYQVLLYRPRDPEALTAAAELCIFSKQETARARELFEKALSYDPNFVPALTQLAQIELESAQYDRARALTARAARVAPNHPVVKDLVRRLR